MDIQALRFPALTTPAAPVAFCDCPLSLPDDAFVPGPVETPAAPRPQVAKSSLTEQLLRDMRPFIRDVHVVSPGGADGSPPILGGSGAGARVLVPESLQGMPGKRWTCTPEIAQFHRERVQAESNDDLRSEDRNELDPTAIPLLQRRYAGRHDMTVVELGPATSTVVPRALGEAAHRYFATDLSVPLLERQRDLLHEPGFLVSGAVGVVGNTYDLPYENRVADLLFVSCHPPFVSSSVADRIQAFGEVARVLKPGGELVLFPWDASEQHPAVNAFVERTFERVDGATSPYGGDRVMVVLRKRA